MCSVKELFFIFALAFFMVTSIPAMLTYSKFRKILDLTLSDGDLRKLSRRGDFEGETGGLVSRFFFQRDYREFSDEHLNVIGDKAKSLLRLSYISLGLLIIAFAFEFDSGPANLRGCISGLF
jgi:hypothetical protein